MDRRPYSPVGTVVGPREAQSGNNWTAHSPGSGLEDLAKILLTAVVLTLALAIGAGHHGEKYLDVEDSRRLASAEDLLEQTLRSISAHSYDDVAFMNGSKFGDRATSESSNYEVRLAVTPAAGGLLKIDAILTNKLTHKEIRRLVSYRGRG
jgi:hypothetical protein